MKEVYCAIDLGATSGRVIIADTALCNGHNTNDLNDDCLEEIYRFPNGMYERDGMFFWNIDALWKEILTGLNRLAERNDLHVKSIGVDSWGCDVVFLDSEGRALAHPRAYRDPYTNGMMERLWNDLQTADTDGRQIVYQKTGIQMLPFNTIYQFYACSVTNYRPFREAAHYLWIADYFNYMLTGEMRNEYTLLSTSQLLGWYDQDGTTVRPHLDEDLLSVCGAKREYFPLMVHPGERIGCLRKEMSSFAYDIPVIAVASHDTASAVATIEKGHVAYLSSGTWSLMGIVSEHPVITPKSYELNFTNEGGVGQTARLLKNITGMWILEQCRREWKEQGKDYSHEQLIQMAHDFFESACKDPVPLPVFSPDAPRFANPSSMLREVMDSMGSNGKAMTMPTVKKQDEWIVWTIYQSMAYRYGEVFQMLQQLAPWKIEKLCIIGGGARNTYLNQLTEQAVGVPVCTGSTEATALGNILLQAQAG